MSTPAPNLGAPHPGATSELTLSDGLIEETEQVTPGAPKKRKRGFGLTFWLATIWLVTVLICAVFANLLPVKDPLVPDVLNKLAYPGPDHWLGTDGLGRDTLARLVHGARVSVTISVTAVAIGMVVGG